MCFNHPFHDLDKVLFNPPSNQSINRLPDGGLVWPNGWLGQEPLTHMLRSSLTWPWSHLQGSEVSLTGRRRRPEQRFSNWGSIWHAQSPSSFWPASPVERLPSQCEHRLLSQTTLSISVFWPFCLRVAATWFSRPGWRSWFDSHGCLTRNAAGIFPRCRNEQASWKGVVSSCAPPRAQGLLLPRPP